MRPASWLGRFACVSVLTAASGMAGWIEVGDAGALPGTAQPVFGGTPLDFILGSLIDNFDVDMYRINIFDPVAFSAITIDIPGLTVPDPQLFLFNSHGFGVYMNDDGTGTGSQSWLEPGHPLGPLTAGYYFLAIGWFDNDPLSILGDVFDDTVGTNGPSALGGLAPVIAWDDNVVGRIDLETLYQINLTGAEQVPEPATGLLVGIGIGFTAYMRRRRARR